MMARVQVLVGRPIPRAVDWKRWQRIAALLWVSYSYTEQVRQRIALVPLQTGRGVQWRTQPPIDPERSAPRGASPESSATLSDRLTASLRSGAILAPNAVFSMALAGRNGVASSDLAAMAACQLSSPAAARHSSRRQERLAHCHPPLALRP
ncbi:hypothetical protein Saro_0370 [Novosphingobium aromaticivorans DSM 12444]|uniref:Uncharacterized protein n=1 Tax=Novosphingobium aromaticivorans (strain ATCC 700278 / DSM 12444 / CCUG 56034 / CIP 105152 / NBRC 16084 / F199) TaxID=279238 RepID=Q2GBF5_NOVAD|nr:hypothetical protein Saro_0370 [Novosphingobium aromaticivorans DSM 12444]